MMRRSACCTARSRTVDDRPNLDRLDRQRERFGFNTRGVGLDTGYYYTAGICKGLEDRSVYRVMGYREYKYSPAHYKDCPLLDQCTRSANHVKVLIRHVWQDSKDRTGSYRLTQWGKALYKRLQKAVERSLALKLAFSEYWHSNQEYWAKPIVN